MPSSKVIAITIDNDTEEARAAAVAKVAAAHGTTPVELLARHGVLFCLRTPRPWPGRRPEPEASPNITYRRR